LVGENPYGILNDTPGDPDTDSVSPSRIDQFYDTSHPGGRAEISENTETDITVDAMEIDTDSLVLKV